MTLLSKLFGKKDNQGQQNKPGGMEDFMYLIRVYYQATMAAQLGISNLAALPDLRAFKQTLKVATVNNRLGMGEKKRAASMLQEMYGLNYEFFREVDQSIKKRCRTIQDVQPYFLIFQDFSQHLMMATGQLMQWKLRLPSFFRKALKRMTYKAVHEILTTGTYGDSAMRQSVAAVRKAVQRLGYSEDWVQTYAATLLLLAKKEPKNVVE